VDCLQLRSGIAALLICAGQLSVSMLAQNPPQPKAPQLRFVFEEQVTLAADIPVGETPIGKRNIVPITGGTFEGPGLRGKIMPGGWDWQLTHPSGCFDLHADYMIQTDDQVIIHVINQGMVCPNSLGRRDALFTIPTFEAPKGKYDWLNGGVYVGTVEGMKIDGKPGVRIRFFKAYGD
jgi:Protein of unknown function (DUF3237)